MHLPVNRGFDTGFGYLKQGNDYWNYTTISCARNTGGNYDLWNGTQPAHSELNPSSCNQDSQEGCQYEDDRFLTHVLDEIAAHNTSQPLFYYWAMHNVHVPFQVPTQYLDKFSFINDTYRQYYAAMTNHMDDMIAEVINLIKQKGMWNNTLILFLSDNGGPVYQDGGANNYPLKGGKTVNWEGGIRTNAFLSGGFIPEDLQGTASDELIGIEDWYATFCGLAGIDPYDNAAAEAGLPEVDGKNMWPLLAGLNNTNPREDYPIGFSWGENEKSNVSVQGVIVPPYKLLLGIITSSFWQGPLFPNATTNYTYDNAIYTDCTRPGCLYDIWEDPTEYNDISAKYPHIAKDMLARLEYYETTIFNPYRGPIDNYGCEIADSVYGGFIGPFVDIGNGERTAYF